MSVSLNSNVAQVANAQPIKQPEKKTDEKSKSITSTQSKVLVGAGVAAVAVSVIAGLAIKNKVATKKALKALEEKAKGLGLTPEALKKLETSHFNVEKCGKIGMSDVYSRIEDVAKKSSSDIKGAYLLPPKLVKEFFNFKDIPENSFAMMYKLDNGKVRLSYLVHDGLDKSLADVVSPAWDKGKIFVIPVNNG